MTDKVSFKVEISKNHGMALGFGIVLYGMLEEFSPYIYINLFKRNIAIGWF